MGSSGGGWRPKWPESSWPDVPVSKWLLAEWTAHGSLVDLRVAQHLVMQAWQKLWPQKILTGPLMNCTQTLQATSCSRSPAVGPVAITAVQGAVQGVLSSSLTTSCACVMGGGCGQQWAKELRWEEELFRTEIIYATGAGSAVTS